MGKRIDLTGKVFGRLTVTAFSGHVRANGNALWVCQCQCGNVVEVDGYSLRHGLTRSCGCQRREASAARMRRLNGAPTRTRSSQPRRNNQSGVVGVSFDRRANRWVARLFLKGKLVLNSSHPDFASAVIARKAAEQQYLPTAAPAQETDLVTTLLMEPFVSDQDVLKRVHLAYDWLTAEKISPVAFDAVKKLLLSHLS